MGGTEAEAMEDCRANNGPGPPTSGGLFSAEVSSSLPVKLTKPHQHTEQQITTKS